MVKHFSMCNAGLPRLFLFKSKWKANMADAEQVDGTEVMIWEALGYQQRVSKFPDKNIVSDCQVTAEAASKKPRLLGESIKKNCHSLIALHTVMKKKNWGPMLLSWLGLSVYEW